MHRPVITRRTFMRGTAGFLVGTVGLGSYAIGVEPFRLEVNRWRLTPPGWPRDLTLRIAILTDLHASEPWMSVAQVTHIVAEANRLRPDIILLLGDFTTKHRWVMSAVPDQAWADALGRLAAPLGVHAVLGNHDWWAEPRRSRHRNMRPSARRALEAAGIPVYQNTARRLTWKGRPFWLGGLGDQWGLGPRRRPGEPRRRFIYDGVDDLPALLAEVTDDAPLLLMAHEPDIFPQVPARVSLTFSGHTHGGQVNLLGYMPIIPSRFGTRYAYGHIVEDGRHLLVSSGLGCSTVPVRLGRPPEIALVELGDVA
jgi:predicted MPP superfamily phosphohydrolase